MFTGGGSVVAEYEYDPYGRSATITGTNSTDFGFTGLYRHTRSNLNLATYRAYDPDLGRWLSRDPAGESGGQNLYAYTGNNVANATDRSGLRPGDLWDLFWQFSYGASEGFYASVDSAIPFWDPFRCHYNLNHAGVSFSYTVGGPAIQTLATAGLGELIAAARTASVARAGSTELSVIRYTREGETFIRYESSAAEYSRITATGVKAETYAAPASDGIVPIGERAAAYKLPDPEILRTNVIILRPPPGTAIIGPRAVVGGSKSEVLFPHGF